MSNYKLPGPGPSSQGPVESWLIKVRDGRPTLMTPREELAARYRRGEYEEGVDSIMSSRWLLPAFCETLQETLAKIPKDHPTYWKNSLVLGRALQCRGEMEGDTEYLELSLHYLEQALNLIPEGHHDKATCLVWLAITSRLRSQYTHQVADADRALQYGQQAINAITDGRNPRHILVALGMIVRTRYKITHQIADLQHGVRYLQAALETPEMDREEHVDILNNLGNVHAVLFERTICGTYMDLAIEYNEKAVQLSSDNGRKRAVLLWNVGASFHLRAKVSRRGADIEKAIRYAQQALVSVSVSDADYIRYLCGLGRMFKSRYLATGHIPDLDEAIRHEEAVKFAPPNDQFRIGHYYHRALCFEEKYQITRNREDFKTSFKAFHEGFRSEPSPFHRLQCGYRTGLFAILVPSLGLNLAVEIAEEMRELV